MAEEITVKKEKGIAEKKDDEQETRRTRERTSWGTGSCFGASFPSKNVKIVDQI